MAGMKLISNRASYLEITLTISHFSFTKLTALLASASPDGNYLSIGKRALLFELNYFAIN
jgi:hypothetical protein